jgi:glutamine amidotransferase
MRNAVRIAVCDVGLGNLRSVERALERASGGAASVQITHDPDQVRHADKVVMPGQGGFGDCARALGAGMGEAVKEQIARGTPYLGICLGLQVLFGSSEEAEGCAGLGVFPGKVVRLAGGGDLKIPHTGWNTAEPHAKSYVPEKPAYFYFVHSYVVVPEDARIVASTTDYGASFVSAVVKDNVFACQFHPEKSQREGLALLERFVRA